MSMKTGCKMLIVGGTGGSAELWRRVASLGSDVVITSRDAGRRVSAAEIGTMSQDRARYCRA
jgi:hypothetical protein